VSSPKTPVHDLNDLLIALQKRVARVVGSDEITPISRATVKAFAM